MVTVKRITDWSLILNSARDTVGKDSLDKEPSENFKKDILISEHSPIRNLLFEVRWTDIKYWVSVHLIRHHLGFHSGEDDTFFVQTQRTDRTGIERDKLPQDAPVTFRAIINAHSIINVSRVRLCKKSARETTEAWQMFLNELNEIEPILAELCVPNCIYRNFCPERDKCCGYIKTNKYKEDLARYLTTL